MNIVLDDLNTVIASIKNLKAIVEEQQKSSKAGTDFHEKEQKILKEKLEKTIRLKREAYDDYKEGILTKEECLQLREEYTEQETLYRQKLSVLEDENNEMSRGHMHSPWITELLERQGLTSLDRETVVQFLDKIEIGEKDDTNQQNITIHYRFSDELDDLFRLVYTE